MARRDVELRDAIGVDAERIAAIWLHGWRDGHLGHVPPDLASARTPASFSTRAAERISDTRVATRADDVVGFVMTVGDEVEQIYVESNHRGLGIADRLLSDAERRIRALGHPVAWLAVVAGNTRARRFYERRGWADLGLFDYAATVGTATITVPAHRYEKRLDDSGG